MKHSKITLVGFAILLMAATLIAVDYWGRSNPDESSSLVISRKTSADKRSRHQKQAHAQSSLASTNRAEVEGTAADPATVAAARDASIEAMEEASTSYDPEELLVIQPYLESADPLLREAAVDAMIVLGDASAGPMLRAAAQQMNSIEESQKMREAADYIELPPAKFKQISELFKKRKEKNSEASEHQ